MSNNLEEIENESENLKLKGDKIKLKLRDIYL